MVFGVFGHSWATFGYGFPAVLSRSPYASAGSGVAIGFRTRPAESICSVGADYWAVHPPSTGNEAPVMFEAAGEHRKRAIAAMSSIEVKRREGSFS